MGRSTGRRLAEKPMACLQGWSALSPESQTSRVPQGALDPPIRPPKDWCGDCGESAVCSAAWPVVAKAHDITVRKQYGHQEADRESSGEVTVPLSS